MVTMQITYLGHAAFKIEADGKVVLIDPWLEGPTSPVKTQDIGHADIVLVTHDHGDHGYAEGVEICKRTGAFFIAINELGIQAHEQGVEHVHTLNIGGGVTVDGVTVTLVQALHSCSKGAPTGFVIQFPSGTVYHAGDTGIFSSMETIGELYSPDVALLPIGGYYTMGVREAVMAVRLIRPRYVIPMHYNTFPVIEADPQEFKNLVAQQAPETRVEVVAPGGTVELEL